MANSERLSDIGTLRINSTPWTSAAKTAQELAAGTSQSATQLSAAHDDVAAGARGFGSVSSLLSLHRAWEGRLKDVRDECQRLHTALSKTAIDHDGNEQRTTSAFSSGAPRSGIAALSPSSDAGAPRQGR